LGPSAFLLGRGGDFLNETWATLPGSNSARDGNKPRLYEITSGRDLIKRLTQAHSGGNYPGLFLFLPRPDRVGPTIPSSYLLFLCVRRDARMNAGGRRRLDPVFSFFAVARRFFLSTSSFFARSSVQVGHERWSGVGKADFFFFEKKSKALDFLTSSSWCY